MESAWRHVGLEYPHLPQEGGMSRELALLVGQEGEVGVCIHVHVCINHMACGGGSGWGRALLGIRHSDRGD